jgi:hypothetical protein
MGPTGCPEMSVRNYQYLLHNNPEQQSSEMSVNSSAYIKIKKKYLCQMTRDSQTGGKILN